MFKLFSPRETPQTNSSKRPEADERKANAKRSALTNALHVLLEMLPQAYSGREDVKRLCQTILNTTPQLRMVWVGFSDGTADRVEPYVAAGDCVPECQDWRLPSNCFDIDAPYSQGFPEGGEPDSSLSPLFSPWRENREACSTTFGLAIPLQLETSGLRGVAVFYADSADYFEQVGVAPFQAFCHVAEIIWKQSNLLRTLSQKAQLDTLTGLMNRRQTMYVLEKAVAQAEKMDEPLSVLICRIEEFSKINDTYGWVASDTILATFAKEAAAQMRPQDKGGRWTGVEFLYVLPGTDTQQAEAIAQALQDYFLIHPVNVKNLAIRLALIVGVATYSKESPGLDNLIQRANQSILNAAQPAAL